MSFGLFNAVQTTTGNGLFASRHVGSVLVGAPPAPPGADVIGGAWFGVRTSPDFYNANVLANQRNLTLQCQPDGTAGNTAFLTFTFIDGSHNSHIAIQAELDGSSVTKLGFFGVTPVAKQATPVTLGDVIALLQAYGLAT